MISARRTLLRPIAIMQGGGKIVMLFIILAFVLSSQPLPANSNSENKSSLQEFGGDQTRVFPEKEWQRISDPVSAGYSVEGLEMAREYAASLSTTGLMVVVGGRVLLEYGNVAEISYVASVRKSILAMLYGKYVADGSINLDRTLEELGMDDIGGLLPSEKNAKVIHLITARSGVYHPASNMGDDSAYAPPRGSQEPGSYMLYNNWDFNAAGAAFELMTGKNIYDALEADLARPLSFQDFDRKIQAKYGDLKLSRYLSYQMFLSTRDMARLGYLMLRKGEWEGRQIIPSEWIQRISLAVTPVEKMNPEYMKQGPFGYGCMWWILDDRRIPPEFRGGMYTAQGAYGQFITVIPALDMVIAHKTAIDMEGKENRSVSWTEYGGILERIRAALQDDKRYSFPAIQPDSPPQKYPEIQGVFKAKTRGSNESRFILIYFKNGTLRYLENGDPPDSEATWNPRDGDKPVYGLVSRRSGMLRLEFSQDEQGRYTKFLIVDESGKTLMDAARVADINNERIRNNPQQPQSP